GPNSTVPKLRTPSPWRPNQGLSPRIPRMSRPYPRVQTLSVRIRPLRWSLPAAVFVVAVSAGCVAGTTATSATSTATGAHSNSGAVHLTDYSNDDGPNSTVILSGAVGDYGKAQSVNPDGSVDPEHQHQLNLMLTHGSFRLDFADLDKKFVG